VELRGGVRVERFAVQYSDVELVGLVGGVVGREGLGSGGDCRKTDVSGRVAGGKYNRFGGRKAELVVRR
jgi:hypothetical protein